MNSSAWSEVLAHGAVEVTLSCEVGWCLGWSGRENKKCVWDQREVITCGRRMTHLMTPGKAMPDVQRLKKKCCKREKGCGESQEKYRPEPVRET